MAVGKALDIAYNFNLGALGQLQRNQNHQPRRHRDTDL